MKKVSKPVNDIISILENSGKAEFVERIEETLDTPGHRIVCVIGVPCGKELDIIVAHSGFQYSFEEIGFLQEGINIVDYEAPAESTGE